MEQIVVLIVLILGSLLALAIWLIVRAVTARNRIEELTRRLGEVERQVFCAKPEPPPARTAAPVVAKAAPVPQPVQTPAPIMPPPLREPIAAPPQFKPAPVPPLVPPPPRPQPAKPAFNWEQFMGVKGFMYLGGLAAFLCVAFFIKYSFDNNLISPELRMAGGFVTGLGLLVGGVWLHRRQHYIVGAQTLCATGVLILYAVTFACRSIYHFEFFGPFPTFLLMALITTTAFFLAARLNALVVAILGMLGGFLTPLLLSTGHDNPLGLFAYIALLDTGLILVALNRRWHFLPALAALGTAIMQIGWADKFFTREKYFEGDKIFIALAVFLGFNALWLAANWWAKRRAQSNLWLAGSNVALAAVALGFTAFCFDFAPLAARPVLLFSFVFLVDLGVAALAWIDGKISAAQPVAGLAVFGLLALWTADHLTNELLNAALAFYFIFAAFHSALPVLLQRRRGAPTSPAKWQHCFPPLALLLVLVPIFKLPELSFLVWPFVLLVDLLAIVLAALTATLLPVLVVLLLTLAATGALIFKVPSDLTGLPTSFWLLGAFAVFFVTASVWLVRKVRPDALKCGLKLSGNITAPETIAATLPAASAALPFLLLIMVTLRLPLADPSPVFGLALLLTVLLLGLTTLFALDALPLVALAGVFALECAWHFNRLDLATGSIAPTLPLTWYLLFLGAFALFPFLFLKKFAKKTNPWAAAALAGPAQFLLVFQLVKIAWPNSTMGLLPAAFAIPALASLVVVLKKIPTANPARLTQLAWFGGVALFFITLIFPIQFDRQWITIGWALEGAALLWLFHRVPHPGLRLVGFALLIAAFARLALNPAVFGYHARAATPIFNWYLYTYGIATVCLFAGAKLLAPPRNVILKTKVQPLLAALGTVLAFLLLNIEIADYFSTAGSTLTFKFSGNFARDMSYSIAWGLFALVLLVIGILKKIPAARYAAMALLCVTLLKLFFHDLARLSGLYRAGAVGGVAVIAMLASLAYQKFFATTTQTQESKDEIQNSLFAALTLVSFSAGALPADWLRVQTFEVAAPGLVKFSLPTDTLSAARPALEDLRLYDDNGNELPFFVERPTPANKVARAPKSFQNALNANTTVITLETGLAQPLDGVALESPAASFIKSVRVEGSIDGQNWKSIAERQPVFREQWGASQLRLAIPTAAWRWLRLTVDDKRTLPVPFTGAKVFAAAAEPAPSESQPATIVERVENPGETRLTLNLGAANLDIASVRIETADPLFTRVVTLAEPVVAEDGVREQNIGGGCIYRVAVEDRDTVENLFVAPEARVRSRELVVLIRNQDSPPLAISGVRVERRPVNLIFAPRAAGTYRLLTGNSRCAAPRYDLAALGGDLKRVPATAVKVSALADNPDFRAPEALAGVELGGAALDVAGWKFRKALRFSANGAQQVELDLDVLARCDAGFADLRVMRGSNQVPSIIQRTSIRRTLLPVVTPANDAKRPKLSRWAIKLPQAGLPLTSLSCETRTALFQRDVALYEELTDGRGYKYRRNLAGGSWTQTPERKGRGFALPLDGRFQSDTLFLETENGDNPPIELEKFSVTYPATRVLFKAKADEQVFLYYGNPRVAPPRYDLSLVAGQLLAADKASAALTAEEPLKKSSWAEGRTPGKGGVLFWGILAVVVVGLLVVISRLLPKAAAPT